MIHRLFELLRPLVGIVIVAGFLALPLIAFFARFGNGPLGPFPGGQLFGEVQQRRDDWWFAQDLDTMEIEVGSDPPRSVLTGLIVHEGELYAPVTLAPLKRWDDVVLAHPDVTVRVDGDLYEMRAFEVEDPDWHEALFEDARDKYGSIFYGAWAAEYAAFFHLVPR